MSARPFRVAVIGGRGIPAKYSGFDTLIEELATRLVERHGMDVTVYCRRPYYAERPRVWQGIRCVYLPAFGGKGFESLFHTSLSVLHACAGRSDVVFVVDPANAPCVLPLKLLRRPVIVHTDGLGWKRSKWGAFSRRYYKWVEGFCGRVATALVTDARAMQTYYRDTWGRESTFLPYGSESGQGAADDGIARFGLTPGGYYLVVARLEPENNTELIAREFLASGVMAPLVVVGAARYGTGYSDRLSALAGDRVRLVGGVYEPATLNGLYRGCRAYIHGHEVGGTNPGLLRAMAWSAPCLAVDVEFNREVLAGSGRFFPKTPGALAALLRATDADPEERRRLGQQAAARARAEYRWDDVADGYADLFRRVARRRVAVEEGRPACPDPR